MSSASFMTEDKGNELPTMVLVKPSDEHNYEMSVTLETSKWRQITITNLPKLRIKYNFRPSAYAVHILVVIIPFGLSRMFQRV